MTRNPTGLYGAVPMPHIPDARPHGGRALNGSPPANKRVPVRLTDSARTDRYVSLSTQRLHAATVYVVAVVDGTSRLTDPRTLRTTTDLSQARRHANRLVETWGGVAETAADAIASRPKPKPARRPHRVTPKQRPNGRWRVGISINGKWRKRTFDTEQEAQQFIDRIKREG
jgi:hypothetical protein